MFLGFRLKLIENEGKLLSKINRGQRRLILKPPFIIN